VTAERDRDLERICRAALERPVAERARFLVGACGDNPDLRQAAERLVAQEEAAASSFLETPAWVIAIREMADSMAGHSPAARATTMSAAPGGDRVEPSDRLAQHGPLDGANFAPGQIFARRHRIVSLLGRGAMGEVYRAEDLKLGQPVALKLVATSAARGDEHVRRSLAEVRLARVIAHPNVCRVYDIGEADGWCYISMELVDGETLASLLRRIGRLPAEKALDMARQLCAGLAAAHDCGVLHRDLKPSNIMVDGRGRIRILDFGLAVPSGEWTIGEIGTPAYMAPEQLVAGRATEQTDLYALGLVFYELYSGRRLFSVQTLEERRHISRHDTSVVHPLPGIDPEVERIIHSCLAEDPAERPLSAPAIAARLPGGDPLAAAVAEGRVPSPDMIAAAGRKGVLPPGLAWALLAAVLGGTVVVASQASVVSVAPWEVPKPPDVLAERAKDVLALAGADETDADREFWFASDPSRTSLLGASLSSATATSNERNGSRVPVKFVYRQSPQYLVPQNVYRVVTDSDPPANVVGMATVTLDPAGHLIRFDRVLTQGERLQANALPPNWDRLFSEAGLKLNEFNPAEPRGMPLVPHDKRLGWDKRAAPSSALHVTVATLGGRAVHFDVAGDGVAPDVPRNPFSTGRSRTTEALLAGFLVLIFARAAILARRNLRLGQGDRRAARNIAVFVVSLSVLSGILRAHHVPVALDEVTFLIGISGSALFWGAFTWVIYISLEPSVRRVWPYTLIAWTRLMAGRLRDPLVGRDVLTGLLAGVILTGMTIVRLRLAHLAPPNIFVLPALEGLNSVRSFMNVGLTTQVLSAVTTGLADFFSLFLVRVVVRKTWIAASVVAAVGAVLGFGGTDLLWGWPMFWNVAAGLFVATILLRLGLLTFVAMVLFAGLLRGPVTLDLNAWTFGTSLVTLLVVGALALYGFTVALAGQPAFGRAG
jgi:predicted Ser/Thr protein kinase